MNATVHTRTAVMLAGDDAMGLRRAATTQLNLAVQNLAGLSGARRKLARKFTPGFICLSSQNGTRSAVFVSPVSDGGFDDLRTAVTAGTELVLARVHDIAELVELNQELSYLEGVRSRPLGATRICVVIPRGTSEDLVDLMLAFPRVSAAMTDETPLSGAVEYMDFTSTRSGAGSEILAAASA